MAKKNYLQITLLLSMTYFISYVTRINYGAVILEMEKSMGISNTLLSMAVSGSAATYGLGQIISGISGDKIAPKRLITGGLFLTCLTNILIPVVAPNVYLMTAVWSVNGIAQAFMWPPMVVILTEMLTSEEYKKSTVVVSAGSSLGTVAVYILSPLLIKVSSWRTVFYVSAACAFLMAMLIIKFCPSVKSGQAMEKKNVEKDTSGKTSFIGVLTPFLLLIMLAACLEGMIRDGVSTWMPTYISETYNLGSSAAILSGVILPFFAIACYSISLTLYNKFFKNPLSESSLLFFVATIAAALLYFTSGQNAAVSVIACGVLTGAMHGIGLMVTCMIPPLFMKNGNVATVSGIVNSSVYIGSAVSGVGTAALAESYGWTVVTVLWGVIALVGTLLCFLLGKKNVEKI